MGMLDIQQQHDRRAAVLARVHGVRRPDPAGAPARPGRRPALDPRDRPRSTASASPTRRSSTSSGCCSRPVPTPPTSASAARCTRCSRTRDQIGARASTTSTTQCRWAAEEGIRLDPPTAWIPRRNPRDVVWHDIEIPAGAPHVPRRDGGEPRPRRVPRPRPLRRRRGNRPSVMTFGFGAHFCLGAAPGPRRARQSRCG